MITSSGIWRKSERVKAFGRTAAGNVRFFFGGGADPAPSRKRSARVLNARESLAPVLFGSRDGVLSSLLDLVDILRCDSTLLSWKEGEPREDAS